MNENKEIEWSALEYEKKERSNDWFWALGVIVVASSVASFIYGNFFFGLLLIIGGVLLGFFAVKKPDLVFYEINKNGLKIRSRLYPYKNIKSFWIKKERENPTLFIKSGRIFMPIISMPVKREIVEDIKKMMLENDVLEEEMKEHVSEKIMDSLGF